MVEWQKTEFDGLGFELQQLPAWDHVEASSRLIKIIGAGVVPLARVIPDLDFSSTGKIDLKILGIMIQVIQGSNIQDVLGLMKMILKGCIVTGDLGLPGKRSKDRLAKLDEEYVFDEVMRGRQMTVYKLLAWAMQVNFSGFFAELQSALPDRKSAAPNPVQSTSTSRNQSEDDGPVAG